MKTQKAKPKTNDLDSKVSELQDKLTRSLADYINLEKRIERDRDFIVTLATSGLITQLIDVLDNFYLAQNHLQDPGLQIAVDKFKAVLITNGLVEINPVDATFSPETMECVQVVEGEPEKVISVHKIGYSINNQVIRPAQVAVGKSIN